MASLVSTIQAALASVAASLPDAVRTMTHGNETGDAISVSSVEIGGEAASDSGAVEKSRVIVTAANFPTLDRDDLVFCSRASSREQTSHLVTSIRKDPVTASATVGLSEALSKTTAQVSGSRGSQRISISVGILVDFIGMSFDMPDGFSASNVRNFRIVVANDDWSVSTPPQIGDMFKFDFRNDLVSSCIDKVDRRDGYFIMSAKSSR